MTTFEVPSTSLIFLRPILYRSSILVGIALNPPPPHIPLRPRANFPRPPLLLTYDSLRPRTIFPPNLLTDDRRPRNHKNDTLMHHFSGQSYPLNLVV